MSARVHRDPAFQSEFLLTDGLGSSRLYLLDLVGVDRQHGHFVQRAVVNVVQIQEMIVDVVRSDLGFTFLVSVVEGRPHGSGSRG